jgi:hypothetical protein
MRALAGNSREHEALGSWPINLDQVFATWTDQHPGFGCLQVMAIDTVERVHGCCSHASFLMERAAWCGLFPALSAEWKWHSMTISVKGHCTLRQPVSVSSVRP